MLFMKKIFLCVAALTRSTSFASFDDIAVSRPSLQIEFSQCVEWPKPSANLVAAVDFYNGAPIYQEPFDLFTPHNKGPRIETPLEETDRTELIEILQSSLETIENIIDHTQPDIEKCAVCKDILSFFCIIIRGYYETIQQQERRLLSYAEFDLVDLGIYFCTDFHIANYIAPRLAHNYNYNRSINRLTYIFQYFAKKFPSNFRNHCTNLIARMQAFRGKVNQLHPDLIIFEPITHSLECLGNLEALVALVRELR
jgi:hypothetical protein